MQNGRSSIIFLFLCLVALVLTSSAVSPTHVPLERNEELPVPVNGTSVTVSIQEVGTVNYTGDMLLLLSKEGTISSYRLDNGVPIWSVDTGGSVLHGKVEEQASESMIRQDPFALPFLLQGDMLFTRRVAPLVHKRPKATKKDVTSSEDGTDGEMTVGGKEKYGLEVEEEEEEEEEYWTNGSKKDRKTTCTIPLSPVHPRYFMNLSTLIRKRHVQRGDTDIFVTTTARIMDVNNHNGKLTPEPTSPGSYLHIVRSDVIVRVQRPGEYNWSMNIAQYKLSKYFPNCSSDDLYEKKNNFAPHATSPQSLLQDGKFSGKKDIFCARKEEEKKGEKKTAHLNNSVMNVNLHNDYLVDQLVVRETDINRYVLWNNLRNARAWAFDISSLSSVVSAYAWVAERERIHPLRVYHLQPINPVGFGAETVGKQDKYSYYLPSPNNNFNNNIDNGNQQNVHSVDPHGFTNTWQFDIDIDADEHELRELQKSYQQCSWIQGCETTYSVIPNSFPDKGSNVSPQYHWALEKYSPSAQQYIGSGPLFGFNGICLFFSFLFSSFGLGLRWWLRTASSQFNAYEDHFRNSSRPGSAKQIPWDHRNMGMNHNGENFGFPRHEMGLYYLQGDRFLTDSSSNPSSRDLLPPSTALLESGKQLDHGDLWWRCAGDDGSGSDEARSVCENSTISDIQATAFDRQFEMPKKIGSGAEGSVFRVKHRFTGASYAVKAIRIPDDSKKYVQEALLYSSFDSANVVRFFGAWTEHVTQMSAKKLGIHREDTMDSFSIDAFNGDTDKANTTSSSTLGNMHTVLFIQLEWFERGTLADHFDARESFTCLENLKYLLQISEGLQYLHSKSVVHCDLKPKNIFMSDSGIMKIGDFGISRKSTERSNSMHLVADFVTTAATTTSSTSDQIQYVEGAYSPVYCSPEQKRGEAATPASDIYSLGVIALEFYCMFTTQHERLNTLEEARRSVFPQTFAEEYPKERKFFQKMLCESKDDRPRMKDIIKFLRERIKEEEKEEEEEEDD